VEITFLGTGAGRPMKGRNVTGIALQLPPQHGGVWLFDCGEGTQHQLMQTPLKLNSVNKIFITHLHGDHTFGLPGLLSSRAFAGGSDPVWLYGPRGIRELVMNCLRLTETNLGYELHIQEIEAPGVVMEDEYCTVEAAEMAHRIACFGYRIVEKPKPGKLDASKLEALGILPGPLYGRLKQGQDVQLADGTIVRANDVTGPELKGRIVAILGDTAPCDNAVRLAKDADVLVHEATFEAELSDKAIEYGHSTTMHAAEAAMRAGARRLVLTHFSTRYRAEDAARLEQEAQTIFPPTIAAFDLLKFRIPRS
jgi:ribonuclease Z